MHDLYLQHPPPYKQFDPCKVEHILSVLEIWAPASYLTNLKLSWKTATLLVPVTAKHFSDLSLVLCFT